MCIVGNPVDVTIDTYPGRTWHGWVDSISPATGSDVLGAAGRKRERQLGEDHATRDRAHQAQLKPGDPPLRAGMSTYVTIDTGHRRWYRLSYGH